MWAMMLLAQAVSGAAPIPAFLTGCWEQRAIDRWTEECWTSPRGGLMIGSGRTGRGDKVSHWEWMRIERSADGILTFYGAPKGAPAVAFAATKVSDTEITFVNRGHDYPQLVRYERTAAGIEAEISLADGRRPNRWSYRPLGAASK